MSIWKLYRYEDEVLAPCMVVTDEGVFIETQPVQMVSADSHRDIVELLQELVETKPETAKESDLNDPEVKGTQPVLLEILNIKKWKDFEKRALMYTLHRSGNELVMHVTGRGPDGMWSIADSQSKKFDINESTSTACIAIADEIMARRVVKAPMLLSGPSLPSPPMERKQN